MLVFWHDSKSCLLDKQLAFFESKNLSVVHLTLFHGMLLQKRKQFLDFFSFQYGSISITKKKTFSVIFGKNQTKFSKKFSFAVKCGIFGKTNSQQCDIYCYECFWNLPQPLYLLIGFYVGWTNWLSRPALGSDSSFLTWPCWCFWRSSEAEKLLLKRVTLIDSTLSHLWTSRGSKSSDGFV